MIKSEGTDFDQSVFHVKNKSLFEEWLLAHSIFAS